MMIQQKNTSSRIFHVFMNSEEIVNATVYNFPVQVLFVLEKLENTLDSLYRR